MHAPAVRHAAALAALALTVTGLAACSKDDTTTSPTTGTNKTAATSKAAPATSGTPAGTVKVSSGAPNNITKRKDVALTGCSATAKGAEAKGTIRTTGDAATYKITVIFTNDKATNLGTTTVTVDAKAKATTSWTAAGTFKPVKGVRCVLGPIV